MRGIVKGEVIGQPKPGANRSWLRTVVGVVLGWMGVVAALEGLRWCIHQLPSLRHTPVPVMNWTVIVPGVIGSLAGAYFARRHRGN